MTTEETEDRQRPADPAEIAWRGIELCRGGDWKEGLYWLSMAASSKQQSSDLPSLFYAFLGYGIARYQGKTGEGLKLCRHATELEFYQPENYYFLARTQLLAGDRRSAHASIERGLQVDSTHEGLAALNAEIGERQPPVLAFLPRRHFLNRLLGRLRHRFFGSKSPGTPENES